MFSIVIPLYNKEQNVKKTIDSILNQTFKDFEVLVVNDGSTDGSAEIVTRFKDCRIRLINQENSGVCVARNNGIKSSKFDWIAFLDADDFWEENYLEEIYKAILLYPQNKIFIGGQMLHHKGKTRRLINNIYSNENDIYKINYFKSIGLYDSLISSSNVVIRKDHFHKNGYFIPGHKKYEDINLWIRLCVGETPIYINKHLSNYFIDDIPSASESPYTSKDFSIMLNTYFDIKDRLSYKDLCYLNKFYEKHCLNVILKEFSDYSQIEKIELNRLMKKVLSNYYYSYLRIIENLRLKNIVIFKRKVKNKLSYELQRFK